MNGFRLPRQLSRGYSVVVHCLLALAMWQGPIPIVHCHDSNVDQIDISRRAARQRHHLSQYHSNAAFEVERDFGWHFHWLIPSWNREFSTPADGPVDQSNPTLVDASGNRAISIATWHDPSVFALPFNASIPLSGAGLRASGQSNDRWQSSQQLRALLCVMRC